MSTVGMLKLVETVMSLLFFCFFGSLILGVSQQGVGLGDWGTFGSRSSYFNSLRLLIYSHYQAVPPASQPRSLAPHPTLAITISEVGGFQHFSRDRDVLTEMQCLQVTYNKIGKNDSNRKRGQVNNWLNCFRTSLGHSPDSDTP
jgi:hypothetical protein